MNICSVCGSYTDPYEWPESELGHYKANLCYKCYCEQEQEEEDAEENDETSESDTTEDLDEPEMGSDEETSEDLDNQQPNEGKQDEPQPISITASSSDDERSIRSIRQMLFG